MKRVRTTGAPLVSVVMANYQGERFLEESMRSVLAQSVASLELIVSDDGSTDGSTGIAARIAREDARVRVLTGTGNSGPGATRNRALAAARGDWIAIVDSDDLLHRDRLKALIELAEAHDCTIAADDLAFFGGDGEGAGGTLLRTARRKVPEIITADIFIETEIQGSGLPRLGYLKPVIRRDALQGLRYNEALRVGEDFDLLLRLLIGGNRLVLSRDAYYQYRRHSSSISHRLSAEKVMAMISAQDALTGKAGSLTPETASLLERRRKALDTLLAYERLVSDIKQRDIAGAVRALLAHPELAMNLAQSLSERLSRTVGKVKAA